MGVRLIWGVDPGADHEKGSNSSRGTGWALMRVRGEESPPELVAHGLILGGPTPFLHAVTGGEKFPTEHRLQATEYVVEGFTKLITVAKIHPLEIVGMVRMAGALEGKPVTVARPGMRTAVTHDDLKRIGMWPGGAGHADTAQAIRHILALLMRQNHRPTQLLITPPADDHGHIAPTKPKESPSTLAPGDLW